MPAHPAPSIRLAEPGDAEAMVEVFRSSIAEFGPLFYDPPQVRAWQHALTPEAALALVTNHATYVAVHDDRVIGFATFAEPHEFDMLYVHPSWAMRGVGSALAAAVENHALARGVHQLSATVSECARIAFESFGYRHEQPHTRLLDGHEFRVTLMTHALG